MRWIIAFLVIWVWDLSAQNLENISIKKPNVYVDGNISLGLRSFNSSSPLANRNSGFGYLGNARLTLHVSQFSFPISYRTGDQLNLPSTPSFKYWGLSPKYKSFQLHIGYRSLRFSDHTLAGVQTYGIGFSLNKKNFKLQASRGILDRQRPERVIYNSRVLPRKEKNYLASSIRFGNTKNHIKYAVLSSKEKESLQDSVPPRLNLVNELGAKKQLGVFFVASNIAISYVEEKDDFLLIQDSTSSPLLKVQETFGANPNISSKIGLLYGGSLGFQTKSFSLSLDYNQIDRSFESFGRNFQITDVRTYSVKNRFQFFNNSLLINSRIGLQQNNLGDDKANTSTRWITNINILARSKGGFILNTNVSNFNMEKENVFVVGQDSLSFSFNAVTVSLSPQFQFGKSRFIGNLNFTKNISDTEGQEANQKQNLLLGSVAYEVPIGSNTSMVSFGLNYSKFSTDFFNEKLIGLTIGTQLDWKEKFILNLQYNPNRNLSESEDGFLTHVVSLNGNYKIRPKQNLFFNAYYQNIGGLNQLRENQIRFGYRLQFSTKPNTQNPQNL